MADVILFIQNGWKNIWKQKTIWLFSVIPLFSQLFLSFQPKQEPNLFGALLSLLVSLSYIILFLVSFIGVLYIAYYFSIGKIVTVKETLFAVRKYSWRAMGCSCLGFILISPLLFWILAVSLNSTTHTFQLSDKATLILYLPLSLFGATGYFSMFGFFANDLGIWQSIKNAWALFTAHFLVLATLGIILAIMFRIYAVASGMLTVLIQSGFDISSLITLNYLNLSVSLSKNALFMLLNGIGGVIFTPFYTSVFVLAYLKYSETKTLSVPRQR
jgi:hypothetical protein